MIIKEMADEGEDSRTHTQNAEDPIIARIETGLL